MWKIREISMMSLSVYKSQTWENMVQDSRDDSVSEKQNIEETYPFQLNILVYTQIGLCIYTQTAKIWLKISRVKAL